MRKAKSGFPELVCDTLATPYTLGLNHSTVYLEISYG